MGHHHDTNVETSCKGQTEELGWCLSCVCHPSERDLDPLVLTSLNSAAVKVKLYCLHSLKHFVADRQQTNAHWLPSWSHRLPNEVAAQSRTTIPVTAALSLDMLCCVTPHLG